MRGLIEALGVELVVSGTAAIVAMLRVSPTTMTINQTQIEEVIAAVRKK